MPAPAIVFALRRVKGPSSLSARKTSYPKFSTSLAVDHLMVFERAGAGLAAGAAAGAGPCANRGAAARTTSAVAERTFMGCFPSFPRMAGVTSRLTRAAPSSLAV